MHIVVRRVDDLCWSCPGDQQRVRFVKPHDAFSQMKQAEPQRSRQYEDEQDGRPFTINIHNSVKLPMQWRPTGSRTIVAPQIATPRLLKSAVRSPTRTTASSSVAARAHPPRDVSNHRSRNHRDLRCRSHRRSYLGTNPSFRRHRIRDKPGHYRELRRRKPGR